MIGNISKWAGSIVIAVIIVTILEMLLPEGKNKKYIKTIMGVYILFTVISPIVRATSGKNIDINSIVETQNTMMEYSNISIQTSSSIENVYLANIKKDISSKIEQRGFKVIDMNLKTENTDEKNFGRIYEMNITINKNLSDKDASKIEKVEILVGETGLKKELSNKKKITEKEIEDLKEYLSTTYDVDKAQINLKEGS